MSTIAYDGRTFSINGRRVWIVGGSLPYARVPHEQWADRIQAAKLAGLNTVVTPVVWAQHEAMPGKFDFEGDRDLRRFAQLVGEAGMRLILRIGPFVGQGYDMGGLPAWLLDIQDRIPRTKDMVDMKLRAKNPPFLEACSRFFSAVSGQIGDLQVTSTGDGGPVMLVQNEAGWTCGLPAAGEYLSELLRYMREAGITVPTINDNFMWTSIEGEIDAWSGEDDMLAIMRQLGHARPTQPRLVIDAGPDRVAEIGQDDLGPQDPDRVRRSLLQVLAGGGQFSISSFFGGVTTPFMGGRSALGFQAPTPEPHALLDRSGTPTPAYHAARQVASFASAFSTMLVNLETHDPVVLIDPGQGFDPSSSGVKSTTGRVSICHRRGSQGQVVYLFADPAKTERVAGDEVLPLILPDGSQLPVHIGSQVACWCVFDVHLHGRSKMDYCGLSPIGLTGRVLVLHGPAGATGHLSINGSPIAVIVPDGDEPSIVEHEGITIVVVNDAIVETTYTTDHGVYIGVSTVSATGVAELAPGHKHGMRITPEGETESLGAESKPNRQSAKVAIESWELGDLEEHIDGSSARYATIDGPAPLTSLGTPHGYGWYRVELKNSSSKRVKVAAPQSADRLVLVLNGEPAGVLGNAPGANQELTLSLKKGTQTLVILADNLGRLDRGTDLGEPKGLWGHLFEVAPLKIDKGVVAEAAPIELLTVRTPLMECAPGDSTAPRRVSWSLIHRRKSPLWIRFDSVPVRGVVLLNDEPLAVVEAGHPFAFFADDEKLTRGKNTIEFAPAVLFETDDEAEIDGMLGAMATSLNLTECTNELTGKSDWGFAKWERPAPTAYETVAKAHLDDRVLPSWWSTRFEVDATVYALEADLTGMTKGQIYLNGKHAGAYAITDGEGNVIGSETTVLLHTPWLHTDRPNELCIFDEQGGNPSKVKLAYVTGVRPITHG